MNDLQEPPAPPRRPAAWTAFGIINLIFGALGVLGSLMSYAMLALKPDEAAAAHNPALKAMADSELYQVFTRITTPIHIIAAAALIAAGVGLLRNRGWGRVLSLVYAWYAIVAGIAGLIIGWFAVIAPLLEHAKTATGVDRAAAYGGVIGGLVGGLFGLVYPILILVFLRRDTRRDAMPPIEPGPPENPYQAPSA